MLLVISAAFHQDVSAARGAKKMEGLTGDPKA
jgi:hypothetical protein